jgi:hypothetical protein
MSLVIQRLVQQTSKSLPFNPGRLYESSHESQYDESSRCAPITRVLVEAEGKAATPRNIFRFPIRRHKGSEVPSLTLENGEHSHHLKSQLSKDRRFGHDRNARWESFKTKIKNTRMRTRVNSDQEQGMESQVINITVGEDKGTSEHFEETHDKGSSTVVSKTTNPQKRSPALEGCYTIKVFQFGSDPIEKARQKRIITSFDLKTSLDHQNILQTFDLYELNNGSLCEHVEYCSGSDLYSLIIASRQLVQSEADCFFKQLMHGINYMHNMGIAHCDLKPENLLLSPSGCLKISNLENAEYFHLGRGEEAPLPKKSRNPNPYTPPERYLGCDFEPAALDIWAIAMIYIAMRSGRIPWKMANDKDECFRDYIIDRMIGRGYFFIEQICTVSHRPLSFLSGILISWS